MIVLTPTVATVNRPTHLQLSTAPREKPDSIRKSHHDSVKGSCLSSLQKPTQKNIVSAVKKTRGASRRMCLDWVTRALSNVRKIDARRAVVARQSRPRMVR